MRKKYLTLVILTGLIGFFYLSAWGQVNPQVADSPESRLKEINPRISLDLKGMDVVEALKTLASKGKMNLVIGSNVRGRVTMFLKDVKVKDAFEIILAANNLASERRGDIIYVMPQRDYELLYGERYADKREVKIIQLKYARVLEVEKILTQIMTKIGKIITDEGSNTLVIMDTPRAIAQSIELLEKIDKPTETKVFDLGYAKAEDLSTKLQEVLTKGVGTLQIDERTNKIVVTDLKSNFTKIDEIIKEFDERPLQVLIDAKIIEITPSKKFHSGIDWDYWIDKYFRLQGTFNFPLSVDVTDKISFGTIGIADPSERGDYTGIMEFLEIFGETKILSSPRILALNNEEAKILVGKKDAYITSTTTTTTTNPITSQTVNFVDTGVKLYVTPTINKDDYITLRIRPEISSYATDEITVEGQKTAVPIVTTSQAETTVIVKDGVSILIGGLRKVTYEREKKQIPLLGSIPLIGFFFGGQKDEWEKDELVIVLTPRIVSGSKSIEAEIEAKTRDKEMMWESEVLERFPEDSLRKKAEEKIPRVQLEESEEKIDKKPKVKIEQTKPEKSDYYLELTEKIKLKAAFFSLTNKAKGKKGKVKLMFIVSREGKLLGEPVVVSTEDNSDLGDIAKEIIKESSPFSPFPDNISDENKIFEVLLIF